MRLSILPAANINKIFVLWLSFLLAVALTLTASRYLIDTADWHLYQFLYFYAFCFGNFFLINLAILAVGGGTSDWLATQLFRLFSAPLVS